MQAKWILAENGCRFLLFIAVILPLAFTSCSENPAGIPIEEEISYDNGKVITEYFIVHPIGTIIHAFGGDIILDFPRGTVPTETRYSIVSFPIDQLDLRGNNLMMRAISLTNVMNENTFAIPVKVMMRYDLCEYNMCEPGDESQIAIYRFRGDIHAFHKVEAMGECCMDCSCKTVTGCIDECGSFVLVEI